MRGSGARRISRTRRIAFSVGSFLAANHRSTSGFGFTRPSVGFADTLLAQLWSTVSNEKTVVTTAPQTPAPATSDTPDRVKRFLHVLIEPRSYLNALYLLTALPLGLTYFAVLVTGALVGSLLAGVLVVLLILLAVLVASWGFALFERELAIWLLGVDVPPLALPDPDVVSPWRMLVRHLRQSTTWRSITYLLVKLPFGIFATSVTVALTGPPIVGIVYPIFRLLNSGPFPPEVGLLIFPGLVAVAGLAVALQVLNLIRRMWGRFAADLPGVPQGPARRRRARPPGPGAHQRGAQRDQLHA